MATSTRSSALHALSELYGIIPSYRDQTGKETRQTSDETRVALLAAMGVDASDERAARRSLEQASARERRLLAPTRVLRDDGRPLEAELRMERGWARAEVEWVLVLREEGGRIHR